MGTLVASSNELLNNVMMWSARTGSLVAELEPTNSGPIYAVNGYQSLVGALTFNKLFLYKEQTC